MPDSPYERILGQLEGKVDGLSEGVGRLLKGQEEALKASEIGRRRLHKRIDGLAKQVTISGARLETLQDRVEGQGTAITELESFREAQQRLASNQHTIAVTNRRWLKWLALAFGAMATAEGDHASGGRLLKWLSSIGSGIAGK